MPEQTDERTAFRYRNEAPFFSRGGAQAMAWYKGTLWMGSRDLRRSYAIDVASWTVREEIEAPGTPWVAVSDGEALWFTLGEGPDDDRHLRRFVPGIGWTENERIACPDFTG